jgi:hypothetical protein
MERDRFFMPEQAREYGLVDRVIRPTGRMHVEQLILADDGASQTGRRIGC